MKSQNEIVRKLYIQNGIEYNEPQVPEGYTLVDSYQPHSCPWDCYGNRHLGEVSNVMAEAGIEHVALVTHRRAVSPFPSGPNGRVRFGDDIMPGVYRLAVPSEYAENASKCLLARR
jgi:hypothetical protein